MYYLYNSYSLPSKKDGEFYTEEDLNNVKLFDFNSVKELEDFWREECIYQEWWPVYKILNNSFNITCFDTEDEAKREVLKIENRMLKRRQESI